MTKVHSKIFDQLDFFDTAKTEAQLLWERLAELTLAQDKMRRRLFAEIEELRTQIVEIKAETLRDTATEDNDIHRIKHG